MIKKEEPMPPPDLSREQLADWWRQQLNQETGYSGVRIPETPPQLERICPKCGAINPCTPSELNCGQCGHLLNGGERKTSTPLFTRSNY